MEWAESKDSTGLQVLFPLKKPAKTACKNICKKAEWWAAALKGLHKKAQKCCQLFFVLSANWKGMWGLILWGYEPSGFIQFVVWICRILKNLGPLFLSLPPPPACRSGDNSITKCLPGPLSSSSQCGDTKEKKLYSMEGARAFLLKKWKPGIPRTWYIFYYNVLTKYYTISN